MFDKIKGLFSKKKAGTFESTGAFANPDGESRSGSAKDQINLKDGSGFVRTKSKTKKAPFERFYIYALLLYIAFIIADLGILAFRDLMLPQQAPPSKPQEVQMPTQFLRSEYSSIITRNIFNSDGKIPDPVSPGSKQQDQGPGQEDGPAVPSSLPLTLVGTIVHANPAKSIATIQYNSTVEPYIPNDAIESVAILLKVERAKAFIRNNASRRIEYIEMKLDGAIKINRPAPKVTDAGPTAKSATEFHMPKNELLKQMNNLPDLLQQARAVPNIVPGSGGQVDGFRIVDIQPGSYYEKLGIKPGDIIKGVNGEPLSSPQQAMEMYNQLKTQSKVAIEVERNGKKETLTYTIE